VGCGTLPTLPSALCEIARRGAKTLAEEDILDILGGSLQLGPPDAEAAAGLGRDRDAITTHRRRNTDACRISLRLRPMGRLGVDCRLSETVQAFDFDQFCTGENDQDDEGGSVTDL